MGYNLLYEKGTLAAAYKPGNYINMKKKVYIRTFGCQMNVKDSGRMVGLLNERGFEETKTPDDADVIIINTCSVREKPEQKVFGALGRFKQVKEKNKSIVICVAGCVAQQMGQNLLDRVSHLDIVIGTQNIHLLPELVERAKSGERIAVDNWLEENDQSLFKIPEVVTDKSVNAFVSIMQGCDNHCAYCIVPAVRGKSRNRPFEDILDETGFLADKGVKEITLLGQNVNAYNDGNVNFTKLMKAVADVPEILRVRFTTSHPKDLDDSLIDLMSGHPNIMENFHLPVQSGSDRILKLMNRKYTRVHYLGLIDKLKKLMPQIGITTDLIVGFPGETKDDFEDTLSLIKEVQYDETFSFRFSIRPGTRAENMPDQVPEEEKYGRLYKLQDLQREITEKKNEEQVGFIHEVLVEGPSRKDPKRLTGRTRTNRLVHFSINGYYPGQVVKTKIVRALKHSLAGEVLK
jgi:tRNA-2-methylthio-N6-dimethylallyladenosine synthase